VKSKHNYICIVINYLQNNMLAQNFKLFKNLTQLCGLSGALLFQWNNNSNKIEVVSGSKWSKTIQKHRLQNILTFIVITQAFVAFNDTKGDLANIKKILVGVCFVALLMGFSFFETCRTSASELTLAVNGCIQFYATHKYCK